MDLLSQECQLVPKIGEKYEERKLCILGQNEATQAILDDPRRVNENILLHELYWVPDCFWVQFKELVVTYKSLHDIGPGYLYESSFFQYINPSIWQTRYVADVAS